MLKLYYPHKPYIVTQTWGNPNSAYSTQFGDPNFTLHNGVDSVAVYPDATGAYKRGTHWPLYCPGNGFRVLQVDFAPKGGGNEVWLISKEKVQMDDKECHALFVMCHADEIFVKAGDEPVVGQILGVSDNTGFSTGEHTHCGLYRVDYNGTWFTKLDTNNATGSYNPASFYTGMYAIDQADTKTAIKNAFRFYQYKLTK